MIFEPRLDILALGIDMSAQSPYKQVLSSGRVDHTYQHHSRWTSTNQAGIFDATLLQKSHLTPRSSSQLYALTRVKSFRLLGPAKYVALMDAPAAESSITTMPPVWFKFTWYGSAMEKVGHIDAALAPDVAFGDVPAANSAGMDGFCWVTKLPQISWKCQHAYDHVGEWPLTHKRSLVVFTERWYSTKWTEVGSDVGAVGGR